MWADLTPSLRTQRKWLLFVAAAAAFVYATFCAKVTRSQDAKSVWHVELQRFEQKIAAGEYRDALGICSTVEQEIAEKRQKMKPGELRNSGINLRNIDITIALARGTCEKYCGSYSKANGQLSRAERLLQEQKRLVGASYAAVLSEWQTASNKAEFAEEVTHDWLAWRYNTWLKAKIRPVLKNLENIVYQCELSLIQVYDANRPWTK